MSNFKLFDNIFLVILFFFLPFSYALTFNIGFPLKISEVVLFVLIFLLAFKSRGGFPLYNRTHQIFGAFLIIAFVSMIINLFWSYSYSLGEYVSRFGYSFDSVLKIFYLLLSFFTFLYSSNAFYRNENRYIRMFLLGCLVASVYSWYLFLSGLLRFPAFLLPGIDEPQVIGTSLGFFIRSGTFKEGNFMGLFLLFSIVLSFYSGRKKMGYFFVATMITTFSAIGLTCTLLFLGFYHFKSNLTPKRIIRLLVPLSVLLIFFLSALQNEDFKVYVLSKFSLDRGEITNNGAYSRVDRLNAASIALRMGMDNPIIGVGISNYSRHYNHYNFDNRFKRTEEVGKVIPNNVYLEIFAEIGILGLISFLYLLYLVYKKTQYDNTGTLRIGLLASFVYFMAFPTFSMLFVWSFFGLIASQHPSPMKADKIYSANK